MMRLVMFRFVFLRILVLSMIVASVFYFLYRMSRQFNPSGEVVLSNQ